jgi:NAD dependent epimerase/dehydratase
MSWNGKRVLVTGAGGFIGSHLTERLHELGAKTKAFVHYNALGSWGWLDHSPIKDDIEVVQGDIQDRDSVRQAVQGCDVVFHLAALIAIPYSYRAPESYVRTNVVGTLNVVQAARELGLERVVHTSTSEVYGTAQTVPISEEHPLQGQSPYSASKIGADKIAESYHLSFEVPVVTVRPFNTYGPRQSARAIIPTVIGQCLVGNDLKLGSLTPTRDLNFVKDTVEGFVKAGEVEAAIGETINLGTGREISIGDLAQTIADIVGKPIRIECDEARVRPAGSEVERLLADPSKAHRILGWKPEYDLESGLAATIDWARENLAGYRPGVYVT